jgi:hypothetical protein
VTVRAPAARALRARVRHPRAVRSAVARAVLLGSATAWAALLIQPGHSWLGGWALMVVAMMWPLTLPTLDAVVRSGFRGWRVPLAAVCLGTTTALWLVAGLGVAAVAWVVPVPALWWQLGCLAVAVVASRSSRRTRLLRRCGQLPPLAPAGQRAVASAVLAGAVTWRRCALLCGPMMAAMVVGHEPVLMVAGSLAAWWEAWHPRAWRDPVPVLLLGFAGAWLVVVGHG